MTQYYFNPDSCQIPRLKDLDAQWQSIPDSKIKSMIVVENQYLEFQLFLLASLCFIWNNGTSTVRGYVDHSLRAGAVKAGILLYASIVEAALRAHVEKRGYPLPANERHRTFGKVLESWEASGTKELNGAWADIKQIQEHRNTIHLYKAAADPNTDDFRDILARETNLLEAGSRAMKAVQQLKSP